MADRTIARLAEDEARSRAAEDPAELREELARSQEEVLRLRDLLIGKDAELGAAKGRLAELEEYSRFLTSTAARLQKRVPAAMRLVGAALRRLRGRRGPDGD